MHFSYFIKALLAIPLLPIMKVQGTQVRKSVPSLEAPLDVIGKSGDGPKVFRLLTMGESTIAGIGVDSHHDGITGHLASLIAEQKDCLVEWEVIAKSGYTAKLVMDRLVPKISQSYDLIVIGLGANDAFTLNTPMAWSRHIRELINELRSKLPHAPIVFLNMPPVKEFPAMTRVLKWTIGNLIEILGKELKNVIGDYSNVYYNQESLSLKSWSRKYKLEQNTSVYFSDGIHPSEMTYKIWAQDAFQFCKDLGVLDDLE